MDIEQRLQKAYKGKRVFLTGHTGFKGSWMLALLRSLGAEVTGYALPPDQNPSLFELVEGEKLCHHIEADILDEGRLMEAMRQAKPHFVIHMAAQALVRRSYQEPLYTYKVNTLGTAHVLEAVRSLGQPVTVVVVTTDKVYENNEWVWPYREEDRLGGFDPYSSSKAAAEIVAASYRQAFFHVSKFSEHKTAIASARAGNVIGGGDWSQDRIVPDLVRALESNQPLQVRNPAAVRPWQHVLEPIAGYLWLGACLAEDGVQYSGSWNFGPREGDNLTVASLVEMALRLWGTGSYVHRPEDHAPHEAKLLKLDINKAIAELHWNPRWDSRMALSKTLEWYRHFKAEGALAMCQKQIEEFLGSDSTDLLP